MTEPKMVSPLLDGFTIGAPVNEHFGVCSYPGIRENSERKYIVKVISVPASQTQLDALLITGAYKDPADAAEYFRQISDEILKEVEFLDKMSKLEGFIPYEGCQLEPMQHNRIGYEVYLTSGFRLSLERYMNRQNVTHLEAVNLGIDLCAALAACRNEGMLYIDLKPTNIFISTKKDYKIGDIGFAALDSLKFSSMPAKYRSRYTAPELMDDLSVLNTTADTYSLGMILYQLFNNGLLPADRNTPLPAPSNADEEMAGILLKACAPNPADRWQTPEEMGQALINYMQGNTINNIPILTPTAESAAALSGAAAFETTRFPVPVLEAAAKPEEAADALAGDTPAEQPEAEEVPQEEEAPAEETPEAPTEEDSGAAENQAEEEPEPVPQTTVKLPKLSESDWKAPAEEPADEETAKDIEAAAEEEFATLTGANQETGDSGFPISNDHLDKELTELRKILRTDPNAPKPPKKEHPNVEPVVIKHEKKKHPVVRFLKTVLLLALLVACGVWGYMFYTTEYLKTVDSMTISGSLEELTVTVESQIEDGLLHVTCTDTYGNTLRERVRGGKAVFHDLSPATLYKVEVVVNGVHKLVGPTSDIYTTESVTTVMSFTAAVGNQNGSAMLNLVVDGHEPDQWQVIYTAEGEPELGQTFSGHTTSVDNLVVGKTYTFRLETAKHQAVNGVTTAEFTAANLVTARDLSVVSCKNGELRVRWESDMTEIADIWHVRCYGEGYDQTKELTGYETTFSGIESTRAYTVEVSAPGMTQTAKLSVSANPITLSNVQMDSSKAEELLLSWDYAGDAPEGGWLILYTLDGSNLPNVLISDTNSVSVTPRIPGADYHFTIQAANNISVFNGKYDYSCPRATGYIKHGLNPTALSCKTLVTPDTQNWSAQNISPTVYTTSFASGQPVSAVVSSRIGFTLENGNVHILYVYRDQNGNAMTELIAEEDHDWYDLWFRDDYHDAELDIPTAPSRPGNYVLYIYFDGMEVTSAGLTIY